MFKKAVWLILIVALLVAIKIVFVEYNKKEEKPFVSENVRVTSPFPGALIQSPLVITGEARGTWYFEASFPVRLLDGNGKEIAAHYAEAQSDWMTVEFVPFRSVLTFVKPATKTGTLVLIKDNPSGLPEHDAEVRFNIRFDE